MFSWEASSRKVTAELGSALCEPQAALPSRPPSPPRQGEDWGTCSFEDPLNLKRIKGGKSLLQKKDFLFPIFKERDFFPPFANVRVSGALRSRQAVSAGMCLRTKHTHIHFSAFCSQIIFGFEVTNLQILFPFQSLPWGEVQSLIQKQFSTGGVPTASLVPPHRPSHGCASGSPELPTVSTRKHLDQAKLEV